MRIREARVSDSAAIAGIHVDTWRTTYRGIIADEVLDGMSCDVSERAARSRIEEPEPGTFVYVAEDDDGRVVGFAMGGPDRDNNPEYKGEVYAIYILKDHQRKGIGRLLLRAAAARLLEQGLSSMLTWCFRDNPSRAFYERMGGTLVGSKPLCIRGREYEEVAYGWEDLNATLV